MREEKESREIGERADALDKELTAITERLAIAENQRKTREDLKTAKAALNAAQPVLLEQAAAFEKKKKREPEISAANMRIAAIEAELPDYEELDRQKKLSAEYTESIRDTGTV